jgi:predicted permease
MQTLWRDLRYGVRVLVKRPGFTLVAVMTLGLGIGVNTALFAGFNLLMRPTQIKDAEAVVKIECQAEEENRNFSYIEYAYYRDHLQTLSDFLPTSEEWFQLEEETAGIESLKIKGIFTSDTYLSALGGVMELGRFFTKEENGMAAGRVAVVVLSHYFWQQNFAGDSGIVGRTVKLNGKQFKVIGVTSPNFVGLQTEMPDIWLPLMTRAEFSTPTLEGASSRAGDWFENRNYLWLSLHARLKPGKTVAEAQAELANLQSQLPDAAASGSKKFISVEPAFRLGGDESLRVTMAVVLGASGLVLLIACSNIANMLLARGAARQNEIGVRLAIGASRWRVTRQLLTESFLLAIAGGAVGLLFARWGIQMLFPWVVARSEGRDFAKSAISLSLDWRVLVFAISLSLLSGIAFGLLPALRATRPDLVAVLRDDKARFGGRLARSWLGNGLVIAQVALSFTLLIPAGLLLRAMTKMLSSDRGYASNRLLVVEYRRMSPLGPGASDPLPFQQQLMSHLAKSRDVLSISPQHEFGGLVRITLPASQEPGREKAAGNHFDQVPFHWVTAGYLNTIGTPIILGRGFTAKEVESKIPVIIVSQSTAHNLWPGDNPLDKAMRIERRLSDGSIEVIMPVAKVIGVARDNQIYRAGHTPPLFFYAPQLPNIDEFRRIPLLLVRTGPDPASMKEAVRKEALAMEPRLLLTVATSEAVFGESSSINTTRIASELATILGCLALLLATLGLYGVMTFAVAQRTREIGVRIALGAQAWHVQRLVIAQGMRLVLIGVVIGVPISMVVSRGMKSMLFGLSTTDAITYLAVAGLLAIAGLMACWMPALRAARVNPMISLRCE